MKVEFSRQSILNFFRKTEALLLILYFLKIIQRIQKRSVSLVSILKGNLYTLIRSKKL